jgi:hypothetical protein
MNEPTLTEAVKTDLPSPKPNRRKRLAVRLAVLVGAVSVLGAAYWFTRPPELVWWWSPEIWDTNVRVYVLVPQGWEEEPSSNASISPERTWSASYKLASADRRPELIKRIFPRTQETTSLIIRVYRRSADTTDMRDTGIRKTIDPRPFHASEAVRVIISPDAKTDVTVEYVRSNLPAFNRTYRQICNSLRID